MQGLPLLAVVLALSLAGGASAGDPLLPAAVGSPAWSPSGDALAFGGRLEPGDRSDILVLTMADGSIRNLTADDPVQAHGLPAWSRDGRRLAYETGLGGYNDPKFGVVVVDRAGGNRVDVATSGATGRPCFADATTLFFDDFESVGTATTDGRTRRTIAVGAGFPVCSPRRARVAIDAVTRGENSDVVTMNPDGSGRRRLTTAKGWDVPLAWSRDGRTILFASERDEVGRKRAGQIGLYVMGPDGSRQRRVAWARYGDISPNGRRVVYVALHGLFVVGSDGRGARRLVAGTDLSEPQWSPDGRWIAFVSATSTANGYAFALELVHPDGTERHTLAP